MQGWKQGTENEKGERCFAEWACWYSSEFWNHPNVLYTKNRNKQTKNQKQGKPTMEYKETNETTCILNEKHNHTEEEKQS